MISLRVCEHDIYRPFDTVVYIYLFLLYHLRWKREGGLKIRTRKGGSQRLVDEVEGPTLQIHRYNTRTLIIPFGFVAMGK